MLLVSSTALQTKVWPEVLILSLSPCLSLQLQNMTGEHRTEQRCRSPEDSVESHFICSGLQTNLTVSIPRLEVQAGFSLSTSDGWWGG